MTRRILLVAPSMHPRDGGPPRVVSGSAVALARAGMEVEIATMGGAEDDEATRRAWPALREYGVPLHIFPRTGPPMLGRSSGLRRFVDSQLPRIDLMHIHCVWEFELAASSASARKHGVPYVLSPHGMLDRWQLEKSRFKKMIARHLFGTENLLRKTDAILYGTVEEANEARPLRLPGRVVIMPNGVDALMIDRSDAVRERLYAQFPALRSWTRTVLFFSRLHPKKGLDLLVEAFARVQSDFPTAGLFAVAIPQVESYEAMLRARIAELQPVNIVLTTDLVGPEAQLTFALADIFSLPSHQEGFSIAIVEAAGAGLPELITDKCHMAEIAEVGAGIVVPDTVDGLELGLRQSLKLDPDALAEMGQRGAQLVAERYTWGRLASSLIDTYSEIIVGRVRS